MGKSYVESCSEVHISEFDDDAVIERALEIIKEHRRAKEPEQDGHRRDAWLVMQELVEGIAKELGTPVCEHVLPLSTAGRLRTMEELKAEIARNWS